MSNITKRHGLEKTSQTKPISYHVMYHNASKYEQSMNKCWADYKTPHPLTHSWESKETIPHRNRLSFERSWFLRSRQAKIDTFKGINLLQMRHEIAEHGETFVAVSIICVPRTMYPLVGVRIQSHRSLIATYKVKDKSNILRSSTCSSFQAASK